ncbi:class I SAM-dependent methyltransferase [Kingella potus]|uniref:class I SAM-dependent methyltransferase n=1 Tax=Kingella potus TaxID=265175 RepID=UPI001FD4FC4F|nr:class I SAM-dependent methyltransferase [Kingella potus]UOP00832.1 class I SAM-dependent methyltransferase [Kingella potus]
MSNWSEGYVNDINYTYGYYSELNPNNLVMPFLMAGLEPPQVANACELGFGQGVSVNIHAAAGPARWFATDFNPAQAAFAESLSRTAGTDDGKINLSEQGFSEFCARDDLPQFDYIGLHGIWSWISDDNRRIITDFLRRKLKVGGVLYISYNTLPGWSAHAPIRHLLLEHEKNLASGGQSRHQNIAQSLEFGENVFKYSPKLTETAPFIQQRFQSLKDYDSNYIAHEYLNQDWHPMYFSQIAQWLSDAKLSYACSTHYLEDFADCLFDSEQQAFFNGISRPDFAQTVKDYMLNRQFRRDYWVKGPLPLNAVRLKESRTSCA